DAVVRPRPAADAGRAGGRVRAVSRLRRREAAAGARQSVAPGWRRSRGGRLDRGPLYPRGGRRRARSAPVAVTARLVVAGAALDGGGDAVGGGAAGVAAPGPPPAARVVVAGRAGAPPQALAGRPRAPPLPRPAS